MDIQSLDLNLLRVFDAIYRLRSVSRAAIDLGLSQPATSQALTRLRLLLGNALFERTHGGVRPTPRADQLAVSISTALQLIETGIRETMEFDASTSRINFRLHMSDIGEARFLPKLTEYVQKNAPFVQLECKPWPMQEIEEALQRGTLDAAIGFLPQLRQSNSINLVEDRYVVVVRVNHPALENLNTVDLHQWLRSLEYLVINSHSVPLNILRELSLEKKIRVTAAHFLSVQNIICNTDLAVVMPLKIAQSMTTNQQYLLQELPENTQRKFSVDLHWSCRSQNEPARQWLLKTIKKLFLTEQ